MSRLPSTSTGGNLLALNEGTTTLFQVQANGYTNVNVGGLTVASGVTIGSVGLGVTAGGATIDGALQVFWCTFQLFLVDGGW